MTKIRLLALGLLSLLPISPGWAGDLHIGAAQVDITPDRPVALAGQLYTRISTGVETPVTATAVAIETRDGDRPEDQAIFVSCDLVGIRPDMAKRLRKQLSERLPDFDSRKLVLSATHSHTAPVTGYDRNAPTKEGVMPAAEYTDFLVNRLEDVCARAWQQRAPGGVSWGLGHAVVGLNRRAVYADGTAKLYGATNRPDFRAIEGGEDHGLELLYFWNRDRQPLAAAVNIECPSQELEHNVKINADFWHDVRQSWRDGLVLGWPAACGDITSHRLYRKAAEDRMLQLRGLTYTGEISRRIVREVRDVAELTRREIHTSLTFTHLVADIPLPVRMVTTQEVAAARQAIEALQQKKGDQSLRIGFYQQTIKRFETQDQKPTYNCPVHVLRLGDIAIVTNPFELFHDYGVQLKGRSRALQTFIIELTDASGRYLPTARAVAGGGYSATVESNMVGPEGGQLLVDRTVEMINSLWPAAAPTGKNKSETH
ncbi:MAG: hypothetical protein PCFJNLEI_00553 [Verrucomicrobiae bacterium]|nr:hypothetical protein [Verrucomicrobiae bacterium]